MSTPAPIEPKPMPQEKYEPFYMRKYKIFGKEYPMWIIVIVIIIIIAVAWYLVKGENIVYGLQRTLSPTPTAPAIGQ